MNNGICETCEHFQVIPGQRKEKHKGLPPITSLFLGLTEDCNARCRYCFVKQKPDQMPIELAFKGVDWLAKQTEGNANVYYFGGEPTLRWDDIIRPLTEYGRNKYGDRIRFNITTNAVLLDEAKLKFMKEHKINMLFSFDGCKECQDYNRPICGKKSSYDEIAPKIPLILQHYPNMTMRMTLHNESVRHFYENHKYAVEQGFRYTFAAINTFADWTEEEFKVLEEQMYMVADLFISLIKQGKVVYFNPLIRQFEKIRRVENNAKTKRILRSTALGHGKCGIGANGSVILSTDGKFYSCQETYTNPEIRDFFYVGNINDGIDNKRRLEIIKKYKPLKVISSGKMKCEECKINTICDGGCLIRNYTHNNDLNIMPSSQCRYENLMHEACLYIRERLRDNKLFKDTFKAVM